jgi:hypothetical protein
MSPTSASRHSRRRPTEEFGDEITRVRLSGEECIQGIGQLLGKAGGGGGHGSRGRLRGVVELAGQGNGDCRSGSAVGVEFQVGQEGWREPAFARVPMPVRCVQGGVYSWRVSPT